MPTGRVQQTLDSRRDIAEDVVAEQRRERLEDLGREVGEIFGATDQRHQPGEESLQVVTQPGTGEQQRVFVARRNQSQELRVGRHGFGAGKARRREEKSRNPDQEVRRVGHGQPPAPSADLDHCRD